MDPHNGVLFSYKKKVHWRCGSVVDHLTTMCKALGSIPGTAKKKVLIYGRTRMNLENSILNERSQLQKTRFHL
jgi:hypothetical protein